MVFNATFNNISVISWKQETGVIRVNHRPVASNRQTCLDVHKNNKQNVAITEKDRL
jgi:hypothetical protein